LGKINAAKRNYKITISKHYIDLRKKSLTNFEELESMVVSDMAHPE